MNHVDRLNEAEKYLQVKETEVKESHWRLHYHVAPRAGWMNDPNGFCYFNGEYHLFYQHHPFSPFWGPMYWGHAVSKDLASWKHLPIALAPSEEYDKDGCFSGSAIEEDGKLYLMYTGNEWTGDNHDDDLRQVQCLAVSEDGIHFKKLKENPVISAAPEGNIHPFHFRDPKVWKKDNVYYCVLGSKTKENEGQVLLYRSENLMDWECINIVAKGEGNFGYMWECPDIFQLNGKDVLLMSPQGVKPEGNLYHNLHQSGYVVGQLNYDTGVLEHGDFQLLDYGFDVYAPQTTIDDKGRRIVIAWMNMWVSLMPEQNHGWAGEMTIPRMMELKDEKIYCRPVPELDTLREDGVYYQNVMVDGKLELANVQGKCLEMKITFDAKKATVFGMKLRVNLELGEETVIFYDIKKEILTFNREHSGAGPKGVSHAPIKLINNRLQLQLFLDESSLEVFIQDGEKVMTGRIYPNLKSEAIQIFSEGEVEVVELAKWGMKPAIS